MSRVEDWLVPWMPWYIVFWQTLDQKIYADKDCHLLARNATNYRERESNRQERRGWHQPRWL